MTKGKRPIRKSPAGFQGKFVKKEDRKQQLKIAHFSKMVKEMLLNKLESCDELLDAQDMKQLFKVGDSTLRNWRAVGLIVGSKIGKGFVYYKGMVYLMLINSLPKR